jgi:hypothetical protein
MLTSKVISYLSGRSSVQDLYEEATLKRIIIFKFLCIVIDSQMLRTFLGANTPLLVLRQLFAYRLFFELIATKTGSDDCRISPLAVKAVVQNLDISVRFLRTGPQMDPNARQLFGSNTLVCVFLFPNYSAAVISYSRRYSVQQPLCETNGVRWQNCRHETWEASVVFFISLSIC